MKNKVLVTVICIALLGVAVALVLRHRTVQPASPHEARKSPVSAPRTLVVTTNEARLPPAIVSEPAPAVKIREDIRPSDMSETVATILGLNDKKKDYHSRIKAVRELTRNIPENDKEALMLFLDAKSGKQKDLKPLEFNGLKNDLLDVLMRQDRVPDGMGRQLVGMYRNPEHDDVWRDYCVQYMADCYEKLGAKSMEHPPSPRLRRTSGAGKERSSVAEDSTNQVADAERREIEKAYGDALAEKGGTVAGTALIAVERLSRDHAEFDRKKVEETALALATDERCGEASRITAMRICGMTGATNVLPSARITAQTGESVTLRMAAIATVGDLGGREDVELLKSLAAGSEKRISNVASSAVARLEKRLGVGGQGP